MKIEDLSNDKIIIKSKLTVRIKQHSGVNYYNFLKDIGNRKCLVLQSILTRLFLDVSSSSRLNALSKEYVVILDCSVLTLGPWKYLTSDKSFSCFSNRLL